MKTATVRRYLSAMLVTLAYCAAPTSFAAEYWAAPGPATQLRHRNLQLPTGDQCSQRKPCVFSRRLAEQLQAGDTLYLLPGTYAPVRIDDLHGTAAQPITLRGSATGSSNSKDVTVFSDETGVRDVIELRKSSHVVLDTLLVKGGTRAGVHINNSSAVLVKDTTIRLSKKWGIYADYSNDVGIVHCLIDSKGSQHGIYLANSGDRALVERTHIRQFMGSGIHVNGDLSMGGAPGVPGDGVISGLVFRDNWIDQVGETGGAAINLDGAQDVLIHRNLLTRFSGAGVTVFQSDGAMGSERVQIEANFFNGTADSRDLIIFNKSGLENSVSDNVFVAESATASVLRSDQGQWRRFRKRAKGLPFESQRNVYWAAGPPVSIGDVDVNSEDILGSSGLGLTPFMSSKTPPDIAFRKSGVRVPAALTNGEALIRLLQHNPFMLRAEPIDDA